MAPNYSTYHILRESIDARRRHSPHRVISVEVFDQGEPVKDPHVHLEPVKGPAGFKPLIIGAGPAGLFAALRFVDRGIPCVLFERGSETKTRMQKIARFWRYGELDPNNNVGFGEGGAGLYSDGKLITRIKSPHIAYVMDRLIQFGAPEEIRYLANPHVGSDKIRRVIPLLREYLVSKGCEIHFDAKVEKLLVSGNDVNGVELSDGRTFNSEQVILATGHSAQDMFKHLADIGVHMDGKSFAMGLRIEHPQEVIDKIQYRDHAGHPKLHAANYKLAHHNKAGDYGVYSFCMCPGGYVLGSSTEEQTVVTNGMSNYKRNSPYANAAIVVSIDHSENFGGDLWGGMKLRAELEKRAYDSIQSLGGTKEIPVQTLPDFVKKKHGVALPSSSPSKVIASPLHELLPEQMYKRLCEGLEKFGRNMPEFMSDKAQLHGIESRTSCPLRITRHKESLQSLTHNGLYPCGEGAGYAGGITSAACDGINVAEKIIAEVCPGVFSNPSLES